MSKEGLKLLTFTRLINNARGQFRGIITHGFSKDADESLLRFLMPKRAGRPAIYSWYEDMLAPALEQRLQEIGYLGPFGLDAFVYRSAGGELFLKSIVEINPRYTMGRVAYEIGQHTIAGAPGLFQIVSKKQVQKVCGLSLSAYADELEKASPVRLVDRGKPQIAEGSFALTDPANAERFLALFHVRPTIIQIQELLNPF